MTPGTYHGVRMPCTDALERAGRRQLDGRLDVAARGPTGLGVSSLVLLEPSSNGSRRRDGATPAIR
jgi:hypothetical protein